VERDAALAALKLYEEEFHRQLIDRFRQKLGLQKALEGDARLVRELLALMEASHTDYTLFFRHLSRFESLERHGDLRDLFVDRAAFDAWAQRYASRLQRESQDPEARRDAMNRVNPKYVLRNYLAQIAIEQAQKGDFREVNRLLELLRRPFDEQPEWESYAALPPDWGKGMEISCSS